MRPRPVIRRATPRDPLGGASACGRRAIADPRVGASLRKAAAALEAFSKKAAKDPLHTGS